MVVVSSLGCPIPACERLFIAHFSCKLRLVWFAYKAVASPPSGQLLIRMVLTMQDHFDLQDGYKAAFTPKKRVYVQRKRICRLRFKVPVLKTIVDSARCRFRAPLQGHLTGLLFRSRDRNRFGFRYSSPYTSQALSHTFKHFACQITRQVATTNRHN